MFSLTMINLLIVGLPFLSRLLCTVATHQLCQLFRTLVVLVLEGFDSLIKDACTPNGFPHMIQATGYFGVFLRDLQPQVQVLVHRSIRIRLPICVEGDNIV